MHVLRVGVLGMGVLGTGCARGTGASTQPPVSHEAERGATEAFVEGGRDSEPPLDPRAVLAQAEVALGADEAARAVALFGRALASEGLPPEDAAPAWIGLAQAHEKLRDCLAAVRAYEIYLQRFPQGEHVVLAQARRGACEAELEQWDRSVLTYHAIAERSDQLPSVKVEALAREGYALFMLDRMDEADARLALADVVHDQAVEQHTERFSNTYFVGMARFYRAAILHRRFRDVEIRLPEKVMEAAFKAKLELLVQAQDAYNRAISAKHMFWVSASGYQLGHLFSELYDALMYAPVPEWLDERQREIYFEELKKQLRPVVTKAIWVFEKNLETARRLGYESDFIERTETKLGHLQAVLLSDEATLGQPHPYLTRESSEAIDAPGGGEGNESVTASDRKLFVPRPTPL
ncbi:tetratricopeptide repeat protein [Paraliomyxa miuraensis]|uniref:tetratricopeptide repeat protein n=1 Tax=Paraliomyxa miuraensis TaxID=376150 RepID=UPI0022538E50|nr:tetratricopeptide repeat protein [Paraliomyxa miuraensis]MCX4240217.1 tetratricopeptide repeat protein [Paraliomyxa miuraensis]